MESEFSFISMIVMGLHHVFVIWDTKNPPLSLERDRPASVCIYHQTRHHPDHFLAFLLKYDTLNLPFHIHWIIWMENIGQVSSILGVKIQIRTQVFLPSRAAGESHCLDCFLLCPSILLSWLPSGQKK